MQGGDLSGASRLSLSLAQRLFPFTRFGNEFALRKLMVPPWHELKLLFGSLGRAYVTLPLTNIERVSGFQAECPPDFENGPSRISA